MQGRNSPCSMSQRQTHFPQHIVQDNEIKTQHVLPEAADQELQALCIRKDEEVVDTLQLTITEEICEHREEDDTVVIAGPDGGWSWLVLLGSFVVMTLVSTVGPCFSLVFSSLLHTLGSSSTTVAWIFNTFSLVWNVTGPVVGPLTSELGHRRVAMAGSIMIAAALIASSFASSAWHLLLSFSFLGGIGAGLIVTTSIFVVPVYFTRRLGRANGILMAGTSVGQFIAPHLIIFLQEKYAFMGATLILGAIMLNTCVAVATFHPVKWHTRRCIWEAGRSVSGKLMAQQHTSSVTFKLISKNQKAKIISQNMSAAKRNSGTMSGFLSRVAQSTIHNLHILKSLRALIIAVSSTLVINGYLNFIMMVPFMIQAMGHSPQAEAWCVSVSGLCSLVTRLAVSTLTECSCFNMYACYVTGIFVIAASSLAFTYLTNITWLMVTMGVWGCGVGAFVGLYNLVIIHYMTVGNLPPMFGAASLLNGLGFISLGPLLGFVKDVSGSYAVSVWVLSSTQFLCVGLWLLMPWAVTWDNTKCTKSSPSGG
nr:monocarboxylate transporter 12-B-like [Procambarus clarkii]